MTYQKIESIAYWKSKAQILFENSYFTSLMTVLTIWALFNSDLRLAATYKTADLGFDIVITITFFLFLAEILACSFYKGQSYLYIPAWEPLPKENILQTWIRRMMFGTFYFWLDWIATLTLIFEMEWIIGNSLNDGIHHKVGAKNAHASRVLRLVRMVRLFRMVKLYKYIEMKMQKDKDMSTVDLFNEDEEYLPGSKSNVGAAMADLTNRRVVILVLSMLIVVPMLTVSDNDLTQSMATVAVHRPAYENFIEPDGGGYLASLHIAARTAIDRDCVAIEFNTIDGNDWFYFYDEHAMGILRPGSELISVSTSDPQDIFFTTLYFDIRSESVAEAVYSIYQTLFVLSLLVAGAYLFTQDVNVLVVGPIEKMVELVRKISANPLRGNFEMLGEKDGFLPGMETTILLSTITKIAGLIRVGFGEAGAAVIGKNLSESSGRHLDLMGPGSIITSIFGFCDVRQFTDTTECLQEEVMLFVNRIAYILHSIVVQCSGCANKNIGDAFLLTWKLHDGLSKHEIAGLADRALLAFCKTLAELECSQEFICYFSAAATARLYRRFPTYEVRLGMGLHVGWAIEGAIGSNRKIDASYLSPHVNFAEFLESSTKAYGVSLLMSEPFYRLLSPAASKYCRQVDIIQKSVSEVPMGLFTYDTRLSTEFVETAKKARRRKVRLSYASKQRLRESLGEELSASVAEPKTGPTVVDEETGMMVPDYLTHAPVIALKPYSEHVWRTDKDLVEQHRLVDGTVRELWACGFDAFVAGDWAKARDIFKETTLLCGGCDGPAKFLLQLIDESGVVAPRDWPGYRKLYLEQQRDVLTVQTSRANQGDGTSDISATMTN